MQAVFQEKITFATLTMAYRRPSARSISTSLLIESRYEHQSSDIFNQSSKECYGSEGPTNDDVTRLKSPGTMAKFTKVLRRPRILQLLVITGSNVMRRLDMFMSGKSLARTSLKKLECTGCNAYLVLTLNSEKEGRILVLCADSSL